MDECRHTFYRHDLLPLIFSNRNRSPISIPQRRPVNQIQLLII